MLAERFLNRFKGLDRAHGVFIVKSKNPHKNKMEGKATTIMSPPTVELWEQHLKGEQGLGIIPITDDATCWWGAIDIDQYDNFDLLALNQEIEKLKLPLVLCRTKSGGAHLLLFLKEPISARLIHNKLSEWAIALGYPNVEVFPKQIKLANKESFGNWLNMPYFNNEKTSRFSYKGTQSLSAEEFLKYAEEREIDEEQLKAIQVPLSDELAEAPPCLQHLCTRGFPKGTRNKGLFNLCIFAKQKHGDQWKEAIDGYNQKFLSEPLMSHEVQNTIKSADKKNYFYTCNEQPISNVCNKSICVTRKYGIGNSKEDIGVLLSSLTKIETTPPTWIITVNGVQILIDDTDILLSQTDFKRLCVENLNDLPKRIKQEAWEEILRNLLKRVEKIEAPEDASNSGQLLNLVEDFCLSRAQAKNNEDLLQGKPLTKEGFTYFRSSDLFKYLNQRRFKDSDKSFKIWSMLKEKGATTRTFSIKSKSVRVWGIPSFEKQEFFTLPNIRGDEEF